MSYASLDLRGCSPILGIPLSLCPSPLPILLPPLAPCIKRCRRISMTASYQIKEKPAEVSRPLAHPANDIWGDRFTSFSLDNQVLEKYSKEIEVLKEEVRNMLLVGAESKPAEEKIKLINTIERLGVSYHFKKEIEEELEQMFHAHINSNLGDAEHYNLFTTALRFRIFRQHGYNMSCNVFNKFKDENGEWSKAISRDGMGMLSFYEATHLRTHGEDILEEALAFTTAQLKSMVAAAAAPESGFIRQVVHALDRPLHKGIPRLEARAYICFYDEDPSKNELLLRFAKLDFSVLQMLHKQELCQLERWWKGLDIAPKYAYARQRMVEGYFWAVAHQFEPDYSFARKSYTKMLAFLNVIDDTFDAYATFEELKLLKIALERMESSSIHHLPDYLQIWYKALLNLFDEFDEEMTKQGRSYIVYYLKEAVKTTTRGYFVEARWLNERYTPGFGEYLNNMVTNDAFPILLFALLLGMGDLASLEACDWIINGPKILIAASTVGRMMNDITDYEDEKKRGYVSSGLDCYCKEYGVSKEEAIREFKTRTENAWKDANGECLKLTTTMSIPMDLLVQFLNFMRLVDVTYKHEDGYTHPQGLKYHVLSLFGDPIPL